MGLLAACAFFQSPTGRPDGPDGVRHEAPTLACRIVDARQGKRMTEDALKRRFGETSWLLLGEAHDNPHHHRLRARWLPAWAAGTRQTASAAGHGVDDGHAPRMVFEHFDRAHDAALMKAQQTRPDGPVAAWLQAAQFDARAWQGERYQPLFDAAFAVALQDGVRWVAGNFSRAEARATMLQGQAVDPALRALRDGARWDGAADRALRGAVRAGHCNALPDEALTPMMAAQRLRDAALALALQQGEGRGLLLAGNGHVDRRHGVPRYLDAARQGQVLVVGFVSMPGMKAGEQVCPAVPASAAVVDGGAGVHPAAAAPRRQADMKMKADAGTGTAPGIGADVRADRAMAAATGADALTALVGQAQAAELRAAHDVVVFTPPPPEDIDHCAAFRATSTGRHPAGGAGKAAPTPSTDRNRPAHDPHHRPRVDRPSRP